MGPFTPGLKTAATNRGDSAAVNGAAPAPPEGTPRDVPTPRAQAPARTRVTVHPAIFTSVRTPTGEGYRLIASARALRADEKQALTRLSPSHEALCADDPSAVGVASYPLPGGRICVAYSCCAGLEHTGRRGYRVYTYNMVLDDAAFRVTGYNPFTLIRAALDADLAHPQLKTPDVLEAVELDVTDCAADDGAFPSAGAGAEWKKSALAAVLRGRRVTLCAEELPTETAEVLWMSLPGPLRARWSFSAGIRYSNARPHNLVIVGPRDERCRDLCEGQDVLLIESSNAEAPSHEADNGWLRFAESLWKRNQIGLLSARTAVSFEDVSPSAIELAGRMYLALDEAETADEPRLLALAGAFMDSEPTGSIGGIQRDLAQALHDRLTAGFARTSVGNIEYLWARTAGLLKRSRRCRELIWPCVRIALTRVSDSAPTTAARMALSIAKDASPGAASSEHDALLVHVLRALRLLVDAPQATPDDDVHSLVDMWRHQRPDLLVACGLEGALARTF